MEGGETAETWEFDEIETLKLLLQFYRERCGRLSQTDRSQYATHEELIYAFQKLIDCFDRSLTQMERMSECIEKLTGTVGKLADEVLYLKGQLGEYD